MPAFVDQSAKMVTEVNLRVTKGWRIALYIDRSNT